MEPDDDTEIEMPASISQSQNRIRTTQRRSGRKRPCTSEEAQASPNISFDEDHLCSICFEPYTNSGLHRLSCLKCGHLFGRSCIKKWLGKKQSSCPQCKTAAKLADMRNHYCRGIKVLDTSEKEALMKELKEERDSKRQMQIEMATLRQKCDSLSKEVDNMRNSLQKFNDLNTTSNFNAGPSTSNKPTSVAKFVSLHLAKRTEVCKEGESRVNAIHDASKLLIASCRQNTCLFNKYGLKKIDLHTLKSTEYVPLHTDVVRDVQIADNGLALTASFDNSICLSSLLNNTIVARWNLNRRVWSCCFNASCEHQIFAATQDGKISMYDARMVYSNDSNAEENPEIQRGFVKEIYDAKRPVFSLKWVPNMGGRSAAGLLISSLCSTVFMSNTGGDMFMPNILPIDEGRIYSSSYLQSNSHVLVSYGPSNGKRDFSEHVLFETTGISASSGTSSYFSCNKVSSTRGSSKQTILCRNLLTTHPGQASRCVAYTYDEASPAVTAWDLSQPHVMSQKLLNLNPKEPLYQISDFKSVGQQLLCLQSNKFIDFYMLTS